VSLAENPHTSRILLVENNADEELLTCRVLRRNKFTDIAVVRDGEQALDYLFARGDFQDRDITEQPMLTLLDLDLPKIGGLDVLRAIRADLRTMLLPVVILSGSRDDTQRHAAREHGANGFVIKPELFEDLADHLTSLIDYWMLGRQSATGPAL
jgi:two-component system response regulator